MDTLTALTHLLVDRVLPAHRQEEMARLLTLECTPRKVWCDGWSPQQMERIWFAVLKLASEGTRHPAEVVRVAQTDYRDLLVMAGFAEDVRAHSIWASNECR